MSTRNVMRAATVMLLICLALLGYSMTLEPYTDNALFEARYAQMGPGDSDKFHALREEMLTPKYALQDRAMTGLLLASALWFLAYRRGLHPPRSAWVWVAMATIAPLAWAGAYVFELLQGSTRGDYPHWADSIGIPLMAIPLLFAAGLFWSLLHLLFLQRVRSPSVPLRMAHLRRGNPLLLLLSTINAIYMSALAMSGMYGQVIPFALWLYISLSLIVVRQTNQAQTAPR